MSNYFFVGLFGFFLGFMFCYLLDKYAGVPKHKPIEPIIKIETYSGISDTTYIYKF